MALTFLHASDIHFGKRFDPEAAAAFLRFLPEVSPDLLIISGDFTQRAKVREYRAARAFLESLPPIPLVVTPGNHDVPLYRVWERILAPHRNYRRFISRELNGVTRIAGATVVHLDSTAPHRAIVNGRIRDSQLRFAQRAFQGAEDEDIRVLVIHHNLVPAPDDRREKVLSGHGRCLKAFSEMGVELIVAGHLHRGFIVRLHGVNPEGAGSRPMTLVHTGTTTSTRGRVGERGRNSLNVIRVSKEWIEVIPHLFRKGSGSFNPSGSEGIPRESLQGEGGGS